MRFARAALALALLLAALPAGAEEGMWTTDAFPADAVNAAYGFRPDQAWLDHVQLSSLRLARGCSAAFVSPFGLVQTNHHCAASCIEQLSTAGRDLIAAGFYAREAKDEVRCPDVEVNQLVAISDVTARVKQAVAGKDGPDFAAAMKAVRAAIAKECSGNDAALRCDGVDLYHGGIYHLYKYRRYQDVRLVFAPEKAIAFFGGDPDNFEFPRYDLDVTYLRVYADGAPLDTRANYLRYAAHDVAPGDLVFTSGHPGSTNRLDTVAQLAFRRDVSLPRELFEQSELRGILTEFRTKGDEQARIAAGLLFGVENGLKAGKGRFAALLDGAVMTRRAEAEAKLRAAVAADPQLQAQYGGAWDGIARVLHRYRAMRDRYVFTEGGEGFRSRPFGHAKPLVRHAAERTKPDEERLREHTEANFPILRQSILSRAPIYPELEKLTLTFSLTKLRETLGPDDPFVRKVLGQKSPAQRAAELVDGTRLADPEVRRQLLDGGQASIDASDDPMILLARELDGDLRALRKDYEDNVEAPLTKYSGEIAAASFKVYGTSTYPDATFTLRLSYGAVKGYRDGGKDIAPLTRIGGAFDRATGLDPFRLPDSWITARASLDPDTPFDFATTNDVVGGNSGSPVIDRAGEVVGVIFDGNIHSLGAGFGYEAEKSRAIAVAVGALRETLAKIYRADRLIEELRQ
ncbi:MAG: S46 family peptidase [Bradyrhizobiaceae bacterium]|nr:S46 family peptidase [Hyphomicrobiales bacterium]MBV9427075.1 S46 family peptidase [Bradyrhizobiaceae bacterium]